MDAWEVLPFDAEAADLAGRIESELLRNGTPIELADVFIAAVAIAHERTLVTRNLKHFETIASLGFKLPLQDWTLPL
jgi:predicted nucleic acid-binding protein